MRISDDADVVRPGVRREDEIVLLHHQREAIRACKAADQRSVRLQRVETALDDQIAKLIDPSMYSTIVVAR